MQLNQLKNSFFKKEIKKRVPSAKIHNNLDLSDHDLFIYIKDNQLLSENELLSIFSDHHPIKKRKDLKIDPQLLTKFTLDEQENHGFIPIYESEKTLHIACSNPFIPIQYKLKKVFQKEITFTLLTEFELSQQLQNISKPNNTQNIHYESIILQASQKQASDIHIQQKETYGEIIFRISGTLKKITHTSKIEIEQLIKIIKYKSNLDPCIEHLPQDGQLKCTINQKEYQIRTATLPTIYGEDLVLRLFNTKTNLPLTKLGFNKTVEKKIENTILKLNSGLILVTGPTNSGKTTTLYACLNELKKDHRKNIITLENPVETQIESIRQSQINPNNNYTFENGLKAILRQDPDVIMIGEIRDKQTAKTALDAAYTGHLVLSTLHTESAHATLDRLKSFNLDPFLIRHCLKAIISQKLLPKRCQACQKSDLKGCDQCQFTGTNGRQLITELAVFDRNKKTEKDKNSPDFYYDFDQDIKNKQTAGLI